MGSLPNVKVEPSTPAAVEHTVTRQTYFDFVYVDRTRAYSVSVIDERGGTWFAYAFTPENKVSVFPVTLQPGKYQIKVEVLNV